MFMFDRFISIFSKKHRTGKLWIISRMLTLPTQEESNRLFRDYQRGDTDALGELYKRWHGYVLQKVKQSNAFPQSDIEDIASEVWILVQQYAQKWDLKRSSWFLFLEYKIRCTVSNELVRRKRRRKILEDKGYVEMPELPVYTDSETDGAQRHFDDTPLNSRTTGSPLYVDPEPSPLDSLIDTERHEILEKAIRVCQFAPITEKILRLRLKEGLKIKEIQERLGLKQFSCARDHLQRAFADLKEVINPNTYEVSSIAPKERRKCEKARYLRTAGRKLKQCLDHKAITLVQLACAVRIEVGDLEGFIQGKIKPQAPRLKRLADFLGDTIYDIYLPPLPNAQWAKQGQELWRMRVKRGWSVKKLSKISEIHHSILMQYEAGTLKMTAAARSTLSSVFASDTGTDT